MGDAMSEMVKGQRQYERQKEYYQAVIWHLEVQSEENKLRVIDRTALAENVGPAFTGADSPLTKRVETWLQRLVDKDKQAWAELLSKLVRGEFEREYKRLKALSPFAGQVFVLADYGRGFVHFYGDLKPLMAGFVKESGGKAYCEDYVIVFPDVPKPSDVIALSR